MGWSKDCGREHLLSPEALDAAWKRIYRRLQFNLTTACWIFPGGASGSGYGLVGAEKRLYGTHRIAWVRHNGRVPAGLLVLHECDNRRCCNPVHLFLGTHKANTDDAKTKGRLRPGAPKYGDQHPSAKLSNEQVEEIKAMRKGCAGQRFLGRKYGVSKTQIRRIERGESRVSG